MEPNKLEQDFKQKLEQRTIQPTEMAWDRLDAMLSVAEEKKKKPSRTWMYMAASFLALLLVGALFLNQEKQNTHDGINANGSAVTVTEDQPKVNEENTQPTVITNQTIKEQDAVVTVTPPVNDGKAATSPSAKKASTVMVKTGNAKNNIASVANKEALAATTNGNDVKVKNGPTKINVDAASLLASVDTPAINETTVAATGKAKKQSVKVDANSLLSSVEGELDDSFRGKVLQSVAKNYNIIKTSVASRNRQ